MILIWQSHKDRQINLRHYRSIYTTSMGFSPYSNEIHQFKIPPAVFSEQNAKYNVHLYFCLYNIPCSYNSVLSTQCIGILSVIPSLEQITNLLVNSLHKIIDIISTSTCPIQPPNRKSSTTTLHSSTQLNTLKVKGKTIHLTVSPLLRENFREQLQNE